MGPVRGLYRSKASLDSARQSWEFQGFGARWDEVEWVRADLEDPTDVEAALEGADYAVHAAALVSFRKKDEHLMLRARPGVFVAGEMLDWEAPTGGYLLTACFASGAAAGRGVLDWLAAPALTPAAAGTASP